MRHRYTVVVVVIRAVVVSLALYSCTRVLDNTESGVTVHHRYTVIVVVIEAVVLFLAVNQAAYY